jgi:hypothetical protein
MSISIGGYPLHYITNENKYIITYHSRYSTALESFIDTIFNLIFPFYSSHELGYGNICGANVELICKKMNVDGVKVGKIIITDWIETNDENLKRIEGVYGNIEITIGASYHALVYLQVVIEENTYYIAIETTICEPYKFQFYIGTTFNEFKKIIEVRYQCRKIKMSTDCYKSWVDIAYSEGEILKSKSKSKSKSTSKSKKKIKTKRRKTIKRKMRLKMK